MATLKNCKCSNFRSTGTFARRIAEHFRFALQFLSSSHVRREEVEAECALLRLESRLKRDLHTKQRRPVEPQGLKLALGKGMQRSTEISEEIFSRVHKP